MRLDLTCAAGESVTVMLNGKLVCEIFADKADTRDDMERRLRRCTALQNLPRFVEAMRERFRTVVNREDHVNNTPTKKQAAFVAGVRDGLELKTVPDHGVPDVLPDNTITYQVGYEYGEAIARCLQRISELGESDDATDG